MPKTEKDLIAEAIKQAKDAAEFEHDNRTKAIEDLEFVFAEDQWDANVRSERGSRPCLNSNDLPVFLDRVVGMQRANRVGVKILPVDSNTDPQKAEIVGGLIRYIEQVSDAHIAYDRALEMATAGGYCGAIRVVNQYENEELFDKTGNIRPDIDPMEAFNQDLRIVPVDNPTNLLFDPNARLWHRNDGDFMFLYEDIPLDAFENQHPTAQKIDFEAVDIPTDLKDWGSVQGKTMRVAEWFRKEDRGSKIIYLVQWNNDSLELTSTPPDNEFGTVINQREVKDFRIVWRKISGVEVLEGPIDIPGRLFPIIPVWGKEINVDGKRMTRGLFRYVPDPQRMYIYTQSAITELLALQPKAPWLGTPKMFEGHESKWRTANTQNWPFLPFNPDQQAPGLMPKRQDPPTIPSGLVEQGQQRQAEKRDIIGLHEASLGKRSNETSGFAIKQRRAADDPVTFAFNDNLKMAIKQVGRVIESMRPEIYDTPRILTLLGVDGRTATRQAINRKTLNARGESVPPIDMKIGKHDVVSQAGPGYATQRQEALDRLTNIMQYAPNIASVIADVVVELMEIPGGEKIVKRLETMLPPAVKEAEGDQQQITPEQVKAIVAQAIQDYISSQEGQQEALKTEQQRLKVEQERLQVEQERLKLISETDSETKAMIAGMMERGEA